MNGLMHRSKQRYSIGSPARPRRVSGRRMAALSNCNIDPIAVDIGLEKLERVLRLGAYPHITMLGRPHEGALPGKKSAPLPSPGSDGYRRNSAGDLGKLLLVQQC